MFSDFSSDFGSKVHRSEFMIVTNARKILNSALLYSCMLFMFHVNFHIL